MHPQRCFQMANFRLVAVPLDLHGHIGAIEKARQLVQKRQQGYVEGATPYSRHGAPGACHRSMTDVNVPVIKKFTMSLNAPCLFRFLYIH